MVILRIFMVFADEKRRQLETFTYRYYVILNWSLYCPWKKKIHLPILQKYISIIRDFQIEKKPYISAELIAF